MVEEHVTDLLPEYALGSLDEEETLLVAQHLARCAMCREELDAYRQVVDDLPLAVALRQPPAELRTRILNHIEGQTNRTRSILRPPETSMSVGAWFRSLFAHPVGLFVGALLLLLLLFLSASNWMLWQQVNELQAQVPEDEMKLVELAGTTDAPEARGYLMVFEDENYGSLIVENVPPPMSGYQYQLWLIQDGQRMNGGMFTVDEHGYGVMSISSDRPLNEFISFGVTMEPEGGSPGPTGMKILGGDL